MNFHQLLVFLSLWYIVGYMVTYDDIVPNAGGYNRWYKNCLALFLCATLWPLIVIRLIMDKIDR